MFVKKIVIEFEPATPTSPVGDMAHATQAVFEKGQWTFNGPIYSRFGEMLHQVWAVVRDAVRKE